MLNKVNGITKKLQSTQGAIALALMAIVLPACNTNQPAANVPASPAENVAQQPATAPATPGNVTTEEISENTAKLIGQRVTVRDEVEKKVSPVAFTIDNEELFNEENILVVNASGQPLVLPEDDADVQITGTVARFVVADIEKEYGLDLEPNLYVDFEGKPAIIAQAVALAPEPGEITTNPKRYYNKVIAVPAEVENIVSPNAFTLDEDKLIGGSDLLVLVPPNLKPAAKATEGEKVVVTGVLRPVVVAELEREYNFTWERGFEKQLEAEYRDRPVLVATGVYPSATSAAENE